MILYVSTQELHMLLSVAQTQHEPQLISYGIIKSLGLSNKSAKHHFEITWVPNRIAQVQQTITDMQAFEKLHVSTRLAMLKISQFFKH